jgi:hypothetical protein
MNSNTSLSTVESLFNATTSHQQNPFSQQTSNQAAYNNNNSRLNSFNMSSMNSEDPTNLDKIHIRESPSFNDSEPPSYFEAIGISHPVTPVLNLNTNQEQRMPKLNSTKEQAYDCSSSLSSQPNHQRHHVIRTQHLQHSNSYGQQNQRCSFSFCSNNTNNSINSVNYLKPSETYMVWSIFTTVYCVFIGVVALVLSIKVHRYNKQGDFARAYSRSRIARNINIAGLFFGIIYMGIGVLACFLPIK